MRALLAILVTLVLAACPIASASERGRVVLVLAGNLSIRDIAGVNSVSLLEKIGGGSAALVNVRTGRASRDIEQAGVSGMEAECLRIGAGSMGVGGAEVRRAYDSGRRVQGTPVTDLYRARVGD